jgi:NTE family protein
MWSNHNVKIMSKKTALILSGGGARGAYQVGVLKGLAEILKSKKIDNPFKILSGVSAGAINTAHLASSPDNFTTAVEKLIYLWSQLKSDQVYKMNLFSLNKLSITNLFTGGSTKSNFNSLLDTAPLKKLLLDHIDFSKIQENIKNKKFDSVIITANNYFDNAAVSFVEELKKPNAKHKNWNDSRRIPEYTEIQVEHVMASSAIPMLFPPISINGIDYGDGCVRNSTPCSPSLRMGAEKLFVIGVRTQKPFENSTGENKISKPQDKKQASLITIMNTLLNAVLLDSVEQDVQRIMRINELVRKVNDSEKNSSGKNELKEIPALCISPSINIGTLARESAHKLPRILRTSLNAFGSLDDANEIISYLLFDAEFCKKLIAFGYDDAYANEKEILNFFQTD